MDSFFIPHIEATQSSLCGYATLNPGWVHMTRRMEHESVLIWGRKNSTLLECEGEPVEIRPGRMVLLPANRLHRGLEPIVHPVSYYWVHWSTKTTFEAGEKHWLPQRLDEREVLAMVQSREVAYQRLATGVVLPQVWDVGDPEPFDNLFHGLVAEHRNPSFSPLVYRLLVQDLLVRLCGEWLQSQAPTGPRPGPSLVQQVLLCIEENLSDPNTSVKFISNRLHLNPDYLGRTFKAALHLSVGQYLVRQRVEVACGRLRENQDSIDTIATQCGFGSRRQFYDQFQVVTGKTPGAYRAESAFIGTNRR